MKKIILLTTICLFFINLNAQQNVILIIADDLGTDYCGFYENYQDTVAMPNIRKLLNNGIRFTNATANPVCSPTRTGILTGRYSFRTGVGEVVTSVNTPTLDTSEMVIPKILKHFSPNLATANIGKWHVNLQNPASNLQIPNLLGYDHYEGNFLGALASYTNWTKITNGVSSTCTTYATTETANNAISFVKAQNSNPFFVWLAFNAPHSPYHLPPAGLHSYTNLSGTTNDINQNPKSYFKASLQALDHEIGRLIDSLILYNQYDNTNFIFIGDNGNSLKTAQIADTNKAKGSIYQYGVNVPFIISGPAVVNPNRISNQLVNTQDLFATIIELCGISNWQSQIPADKPIDSKSIMPIILNQDIAVRPWAFTEIFKVLTDSYDGKAIRNLDYKLLYFDDGRIEFYNLSEDPEELNDLSLGVLSQTDITNYVFLCEEFHNLIGGGSQCAELIGINENSKSNSYYLNPFHATIENNFYGQKSSLLTNLGQEIYTGFEIEKQDFTDLEKGIYFLKTPIATVKLIKE